MPTERLILLPGLDGTGKLFSDFMAALPNNVVASFVSYPLDRFETYDQLLHFVRASLPRRERFVLLAESFSSPLAVSIAATSPANLAGLVICAGFVRSPLSRLTTILKFINRPVLFKFRPPRWVLEYFLVGGSPSSELIGSLENVLRAVNPEVVSHRVRAVLECDVRSELARTKIPIMYIRAANDRLVGVNAFNDFIGCRRDTQAESVIGPHLVLQREPRQTAELVAQFMHRLDM